MWKCEMGCKDVRAREGEKPWLYPRQANWYTWKGETSAALCSECYNLMMPRFRALPEWEAFKRYELDEKAAGMAYYGRGDPAAIAAAVQPVRAREEAVVLALHRAVLALLAARKAEVAEANKALTGTVMDLGL